MALRPILTAISALGSAGQAAVEELLKNASASEHAVDADQDDQPSKLSQISQYDLDILVQIRQAHQSKETSDACRPLKSTDLDPTDTHSAALQGDKAPVADSSVRQQLAGKIYETLRLSGINIKGETSGLARQFRWTKQASGTASTDKDVTGNTANARRAASSRCHTPNWDL